MGATKQFTEKQYLKSVRKRLLKKSKRWGALLYRFNRRTIEIEVDFLISGMPAYSPKMLASCILDYPMWGMTTVEDLQRYHKKGFLRDTKGVERFLRSNKRIDLPDYV